MLALAKPSEISIHALRGEGDDGQMFHFFVGENFYPRPPWGGRHASTAAPTGRSVFLSTPSVGRATLIFDPVGEVLVISIHALRGEGDDGAVSVLHDALGISIHALRGEGDATTWSASARSSYFYPRPPWGGRPLCLLLQAHCLRISIHALRGEGDEGPDGTEIHEDIFLSTPSVGRATSSPMSPV